MKSTLNLEINHLDEYFTGPRAFVHFLLPFGGGKAGVSNQATLPAANQEAG